MDDIYSKKPWLKFYDPHVPEHLTYDDKSYARLFSEAVQRLPKQTAVKYMGTVDHLCRTGCPVQPVCPVSSLTGG